MTGGAVLHLFHPALVHFSVALLVCGAVAEGLGIATSRERLERTGAAAVVAGTLSLLPTIAAGYLAANSVSVPDAARALLERHERLGLAVLAVFSASQLLKAWWGGRPAGAPRVIYAALLAIGLLLVVWVAFLGGDLVYSNGIGVERPAGVRSA